MTTYLLGTYLLKENGTKWDDIILLGHGHYYQIVPSEIVTSLLK